MNCYLCNNDLSFQAELIAESYEMRWNAYNKENIIVKCTYCGLTQLIPQWTSEELKQIYSRYSKKEDFKGQCIKEHDFPIYIDNYLKENDTILEVGCSFGNNVFRLKELGYKIFGIDKDPSVCDEKTIFNLDISILKQEEYKNTFNIIFGIHLLEHLNNPIEFINNCYSSLKSKGKLILEIPNIEDPLLTLYKNKAFNNFYWIPDHSFFYIPSTIKNIIIETKFNEYKIIRKQRYGLINHLNWFYRNKPTNNIFDIDIIDAIYKWFLCKILKKSDTLILILEKGK